MPSSFHSLLLPFKRKPRPKRRGRKSRKEPSASKSLAAAAYHDTAEGASSDLKSSASGGGGCLVQPLGNLILAAARRANLRDAGLGALRPLPDDLLLDVLGLLPARDLAALSTASKAL